MENGHYRNVPVVNERGAIRGNVTYYAILKFLTDHFADVVYNLPPDHYLFSRDGCKPGIEFLPGKVLGARYRYWVLDKIPELAGNRDYTLYSWKHTGVVEAIKAGLKPYEIMKQTGHRNR